MLVGATTYRQSSPKIRVEWGWGRSSQQKTYNASETGQIKTKVTTDSQYEVAYALSIDALINDFGWPWTTITHSVSKRMRLSEPTTKIWMRDTISHEDVARWLVSGSGSVRFMQIFVGRASNDSVVVAGL